MDADRLAAGQALVGGRVVGQQRHAVAHHLFEHAARDRHPGARRTELDAVLDPRQLADRFAGVFLAQQDEAAIDRQRLEGDLHHPRQHVVDRVGPDQHLGEPGHVAEDLAAVRLLERLALVGGRRRRADAALLEAVVGLEGGDRPNDRGRAHAHLGARRAGRRPAGWDRRGRLLLLALQRELEDADLDDVAAVHRRPLDRRAVDLDAVGAHQVVHHPAGPFAAKRGMPARHREVGQHNLVLGAAAEAHLVPAHLKALLFAFG